MTSVLDNPIWNALTSGSAAHARGNDRVRYMDREKGLFVGFRSYSEDEWRDLDAWFTKGDSIILFTAEERVIPESWEVKIDKALSQMVLDPDAVLPQAGQTKARPLSETNVSAMLEITSLTNPGPFFQKTIELGFYEGIFEGNRLAAMVGQRLRPDPYVEISAVCTHPDFLGKGYAATLLRNQIEKILKESKTPFLHVFPDNVRAIQLYERLGFRARREMRVYFLKKAA